MSAESTDREDSDGKLVEIVLPDGRTRSLCLAANTKTLIVPAVRSGVIAQVLYRDSGRRTEYGVEIWVG